MVIQNDVYRPTILVVFGLLMTSTLAACRKSMGDLDVGAPSDSGSMVLELDPEAVGSKLTYHLYCKENSGTFGLVGTGTPQGGGSGKALTFEFPAKNLSLTSSCYLQGVGNPNNTEVKSFKGDQGVYLRSEPQKPVKDSQGSMVLTLVLIPQYEAANSGTSPSPVTVSGSVPLGQPSIGTGTSIATGTATGTGTSIETGTATGTGATPIQGLPAAGPAPLPAQPGSITQLQLNGSPLPCPISVCR